MIINNERYCVFEKEGKLSALCQRMNSYRAVNMPVSPAGRVSLISAKAFFKNVGTTVFCILLNAERSKKTLSNLRLFQCIDINCPAPLVPG